MGVSIPSFSDMVGHPPRSLLNSTLDGSFVEPRRCIDHNRAVRINMDGHTGCSPLVPFDTVSNTLVPVDDGMLHHRSPFVAPARTIPMMRSIMAFAPSRPPKKLK